MKILRKTFRYFIIRHASRSFIIHHFFYCLLPTACLYAAGTTVGDVLNLKSSVRSSALAGTFLFDEGVGGNPAYLKASDEIDFRYFLSPLGSGIFDLNAKTKKNNSVFGGGFFSHDAGSIDIEIPGSGSPDETADYIQEVITTKNLQKDYVMLVSGSYLPLDALTLGLSVKYLDSTLLESYSLKAVSYDVGMAVSYTHLTLPTKRIV